jgi:hypothetical protein
MSPHRRGAESVPGIGGFLDSPPNRTDRPGFAERRRSCKGLFQIGFLGSINEFAAAKFFCCGGRGNRADGCPLSEGKADIAILGRHVRL